MIPDCVYENFLIGDFNEIEKMIRKKLNMYFDEIKKFYVLNNDKTDRKNIGKYNRNHRKDFLRYEKSKKRRR